MDATLQPLGYVTCNVRPHRYSNIIGRFSHRFYDTTSILRFITKRFNLPILAGLARPYRGVAILAHDPEKWLPVFEKNSCPNNKCD